MAGTTFTLPNYTGALFELGKINAKFLSVIGGLNGMTPIADVTFGISTYDLGSDDSNGDHQEGQAAPASTEVARSAVQNVVEIFHESVEVSYTKQGAIAKIGDYDDVNIPQGTSNVTNELPWQVVQRLRKIARMANYQFINGTYAFPTNNSSPRKTRGLLPSITTNATAAAAAALDVNLIEGLVKDIFDGGGLEDENGATILCNSAQKIHIDRLYGKAPDSREVGGVMLERLYTPLGEFNVLIDRHMPQDDLAIASLDVCKPVGLVVPGKGIIFEEPLAKTGASDKTQIYGEIGLDHGPEKYHGKLTGLATALPS
jgi:hypothetical protein